MSDIDVTAEPVKAYKFANICVSQGRAFFTPLTYPDRSQIYGPNLTECKCEQVGTLRMVRHAFLEVYPDDTLPIAQCSCGWYALKSVKTAKEIVFASYNTQDAIPIFPALLTVELFGKVIETSAGYRAQYQRVMEVKTLQKCGLCKADMDDFFWNMDAEGSSMVVDIHLCNDCVSDISIAPRIISGYRVNIATLRNALGTEIAVEDWRRP